jgi:hypothetical protein
MSFQVNMPSYLYPTSFTPLSYGAREKNLSVYAQRVWWCYSVDTEAMVDRTRALVFYDVFETQPTTIAAYKVKSARALEGTYVTVIKRFCKKVSVLQVFDDWICKHYPTKRNGIDTFSIWHPTQSEIKDRVINDPHVNTRDLQREKSWCYEKGVYYATNSDLTE